MWHGKKKAVNCGYLLSSSLNPYHRRRLPIRLAHVLCEVVLSASLMVARRLLPQLPCCMWIEMLCGGQRENGLAYC